MGGWVTPAPFSDFFWGPFFGFNFFLGPLFFLGPGRGLKKPGSAAGWGPTDRPFPEPHDLPFKPQGVGEGFILFDRRRLDPPPPAGSFRKSPVPRAPKSKSKPTWPRFPSQPPAAPDPCFAPHRMTRPIILHRPSSSVIPCPSLALPAEYRAAGFQMVCLAEGVVSNIIQRGSAPSWDPRAHVFF